MAESGNKLKIGLVVAACVLGALLAGNFGAMAAAFAGDRSPGYFAMQCFMVWGGLGGVSLGVIPGLALGRLLGMRRLGPWLAVAASIAVSAILVTVLAESHALSNDVNVLGPMHAGAVLLAAAISGVAFLPLVRRSAEQHGESIGEETKS